MTPDERLSQQPHLPDTAEPPLGDYSSLDAKIQRAQLRRHRTAVWAKRGALAGALGWLLVLAIGSIVGASKVGISFDNRMEVDLILFALTPLVLFFAAGVGASVGALIDLVRPIYLALFDMKQFEREYGGAERRDEV
jgi:hypothetical protein